MIYATIKVLEIYIAFAKKFKGVKVNHFVYKQYVWAT